MKKRDNQKWIILALVSLFTFLLAASGLFKSLSRLGQVQDLTEIAPQIKKYSVEYQSERGFGNDRFDIYAFSLKDQSPDPVFYKKDPEFDLLFTSYGQMMTSMGEEDTQVLKSLTEDVNLLKASPDLEYAHYDQGGTKKIYLYSPSLNRGYCMIITI